MGVSKLRQKKNGSQLIGWLRIPKHDAEKLLLQSGRRGVFCSVHEVSGKTGGPQIIWIHRKPDETTEEYWDRLTDLAVLEIKESDSEKDLAPTWASKPNQRTRRRIGPWWLRCRARRRTGTERRFANSSLNPKPRV